MSKEQVEICAKYGAEYYETDLNLKAGVADDVFAGVIPLNGLRHPPVGDTSGWYIWAGGEPNSSSDYFKPLHLEHIDERRPDIVKFLALPPGWRFQVASDHEDVWYDPSLLTV